MLEGFALAIGALVVAGSNIFLARMLHDKGLAMMVLGTLGFPLGIAALFVAAFLLRQGVSALASGWRMLRI